MLQEQPEQSRLIWRRQLGKEVWEEVHKALLDLRILLTTKLLQESGLNESMLPVHQMTGMLFLGDTGGAQQNHSCTLQNNADQHGYLTVAWCRSKGRNGHAQKQQECQSP